MVIKMKNDIIKQNKESWDALAKAGFAVERVVEETDKSTLDSDCGYYSSFKAKKFPQSIILKARKL